MIRNLLIGLTYDLRDDYLKEGYTEEETAEFDQVATIEAIEDNLQSLGFETDRIGHAKHLADRLVQGHRWDLVFNIAEGLYGFGREALVPALLDAYSIPYTFSDPLVLTMTLHKGMTKHVVRDLGIPTPNFVVIESETDIENIHLPFPLFAKPVAEGTGKGVTAASKIFSKEELSKVCRKLLARYLQPVLVETYLPGREFTVGIVGSGAFARTIGCMEVILGEHADQGVYSYRNKEKYEELVTYRLAADSAADQAREVALASWRGLRCRDAGRVDLRADENGIPNFVEVNPLAGLHPTHSDLPILCGLAGLSYRELIFEIVESALRRIAHT
jgi:D-alanine-D-alanine ligase